MSLVLREARACGNRLLDKLPDQYLESLLPRLQRVHNAVKDVIYEQNGPVSHVHFPCNCALSTMIYMESGAAIEVGTIGNEGFAGVELLLRASVALETCVCQIEGDSLRMTADNFRESISGSTPLRQLAECYFQCYLAQMSQSVACNRMHTIDARFARWLLITDDRMRGNNFYLTQEFIADMLGVHRPSVSLVASTFQSAGLIEYSRGRIKIIDRKALEKTSCECYAAVRTQFNRVLKTPFS